jgi:AraC family transcriptional activator of tynA and feaB
LLFARGGSARLAVPSRSRFGHVIEETSPRRHHPASQRLTRRSRASMTPREPLMLQGVLTVDWQVASSALACSNARIEHERLGGGTPMPAKSNTQNFAVWDSDLHPQKAAFNSWRESVMDAPLRLSMACNSKEDFRARLELVDIGKTVIARRRTSEYLATRSETEISNSSIDGFLLMSVLSGKMQIEMGNRSMLFEPGDLWVLDLQRPMKMNLGAGSSVSVHIPREEFSSIAGPIPKLDGLARCQKRTPLGSCLYLIYELIGSRSDYELKCLYDACFSLLPLELREQDAKLSGSGRPILQRILEAIDQNIACPELSPTWIASKLNISPRYVHKLFLELGVTFSSFVMSKRLDYVRADLRASATRNQSLTVLALRWGFNDPGTLHRAFKKKFGCTPRQIYHR